MLNALVAASRLPTTPRKRYTETLVLRSMRVAS